MNPTDVRIWIGIGRDIIITILATFILVWEIVIKVSPNPYGIAAGLTLLGIPPALRIDQIWGRSE